MEKIVYIVENSVNGERVDKALTTYCTGYSRTFFQQLMRTNCISLNGVSLKKPSTLVKTGDCLEVTVPPQKLIGTLELPAETMGVSILFEHPDFLIVYKPAGLIMHSPFTHSTAITLVDWLIHSFSELTTVGYHDRPGIVHRLDKDTTGILIVPRNNKAHAHFSMLFQTRLIEKKYLAVVAGHPPVSGTIEYTIGRDNKYKHKMSSTVAGGREATTHYKVLEYFLESSLLELHPITGRTHQIRVHCAAIGHPLLGDTTYGSSHKLITRQALHAFQLSFMYNDLYYSFWHTPATDMQELISTLRVKDSPLTDR
ncbi:RluA family pseudouridine synthase [Candidatus Dependentiae bacterium]|nr:RluA family pseudouridine synthase [Candidatus Dependentiae bacterium]